MASNSIAIHIQTSEEEDRLNSPSLPHRPSSYNFMTLLRSFHNLDLFALLPATPSHFFFSERATTPGSSLPSRSSTEAPPPVEQCEMPSSAL